MSQATFLVGDVFDRVAELPDASIDLVLTSPPFLALRSYLPADHPDKAKEIGSEPTPEAFIDTLLDLTEALLPKLAPHGSIAIELGDTYSGSGGAGGDYNADGLRDGQEKFSGSSKAARGAAHRALTNDGGGHHFGGAGWPEAKSLCLIPESYRWALVYGRNPFNGRETPRWRARNVVRWCRPNPPVGALGDKVRPATSDMVIACQSARRYFDLDAVRLPAQDYSPRNGSHERNGIPGRAPQVSNAADENGHRIMANPNGAPPLDHWWHDDTFDQDAWLISTEPYKGSHYATWPTDLLVKPILSMCPERVCRTCGEPSRRTHAENPDYEGRAGGPTNRNDEQGANLKGFPHKAYAPSKWTPDGWTDCDHDDYRKGVVLDPFGGSGTTGLVATGHGRDCILIDIDARNLALAQERIGMFLVAS